MGEETNTKEIGSSPVIPTRDEPVDLTLFRNVQRDIGYTASNEKLFNEVVNDDIKKSLGNDGKIDKSLFKTVHEYIDIVREPYAVEYYGAGEIYNGLTEGKFETIDKYILDKIKKSNQKPTFDVYNKILKALEDVLNISDDHETMHRIITVNKFIEHGTQRI
jgi:hypothetical protein